MSTTIEELTLEDIDYELPSERIAQVPLEPRDASLLLEVMGDGQLIDARFADLPELLQPGDLLVANETRVRQARLAARLSNGGNAEVLVLAPHGDAAFQCLVRPGRRLPEGTRLSIADDLVAVIGAPGPGHPGARIVRFESDGDIVAAIERHGAPPLPPYITSRLADAQRYQTTYATGSPDSAAAPTAGLHFTDAVRTRLADRGVSWTTLRLQVGLGTFAPIRASDVREHSMHEETFELPESTAEMVNRTRASGGRVVAVGTTSVRVLESCADERGIVVPRSGATRLYITPGYRFRAIDGMLTNFHQPRSSLVVMVAALMGFDTWRRAYDHALAGDYRFLSFGDCMLAWAAS